MDNKVAWVETDKGLVPFLKDYQIAWSPQPGSQEAFLNCPIFEKLYEGERGPGKTDTLLMDFAKNVGKGFGADWKGVLFRKTYKQLEDVISKSEKWYKKIFPGAYFNRSLSKYYWVFPDGEKLYFRTFEKPSDYWNYHGHAYPWIGWEELTLWSDPKCYLSMFSCSRSTNPLISNTIASTTNPYGVGHNWVKSRWRLPIKKGNIVGKVIRDSYVDGTLEEPRVAVHGTLQENKVLLHADPKYINRLKSAARNKAELEAWLYGSWDIVSGGMFDDIWYDNKDKIVIKPFDIPKNWIITRSFDWGSSKPFSVGWWAESDGSDVILKNGKRMSTIPGDIFRIFEWYGCVQGSENEGLNMLATDIAKGIIQREKNMGIHGRAHYGVADGSIFDETNGNCIARDFEINGIFWDRANKSPGSRTLGWHELRKRLTNSHNGDKPRENKGLFIFDTCNHWLRTVPVLPRSDKDPDDVNTEAEDHIADETRYRLTYHVNKINTRKSVGIY